MEVSPLFLAKTDLNVAISKAASESQNVIYTSFEKSDDIVCTLANVKILL